MKTLMYAQSGYSFLQSLISIEALCFAATKNGFKQVVLADNNGLFGFKEFEKACEKHHLKPIYGLSVKVDNQTYVLIAIDNLGYLQLVELSSCEELTYQMLKQNSNHCYVMINSSFDFMRELVIQQNNDIMSFLSDFANDFKNPLVGLSLQQSSMFSTRNVWVKHICEQLNIQVIASHPINSLQESDQETLVLLEAIDQLKSIKDNSLKTHKYESLLSSIQLDKLYGELTKQTDELLSQCDVDLKLFTTTLPQYPNEFQVDNDTYLKQLAKAGLKKRFNQQAIPQVYIDRLEYELEVISNLHFANYFLVVYDIVLFSKRNKILIGPGRGSSGGCLVAYCLGITQIDPIKYDLIFERFLNPQRISMPDIDIDFIDTRRDEIYYYLSSKYGRNHVAHIITYVTYTQKAVIRDVAKAYQLDENHLKKILNAINQAKQETLAGSYKVSETLRLLIKTEKAIKKVFEMALKLEGLPKTRSFHAAGIVISEKPLNQVIPTCYLNDHRLCVSYSMEYLEAMGLIKMDILAIRNLSIIEEVIAHIGNFNLDKIPFDDAKTFKLLSHGYTLGIFQLESVGMTRLLVEGKANCLSDIVDANALYRPGPMQSRAKYLQNKFNPDKIEKIHPVVDEILQSSHGILLFQEQVMEIARKIAGFSYGKADILRKAMSKKNESLMNKLKPDFFSGVNDEALANLLWDKIIAFSDYGFNKSHAVAYSIFSYQMAYLKAHYPHYFYIALLNGSLGSAVKIKQILDESKRLGVKISLLSLKDSSNRFEYREHQIHLPLTMVSGISSEQVGNWIKYRQDNVIDNYFDVIAGLTLLKFNKEQILNLIFSGSFDYLNINRTTLSEGLEDALRYADLIRIDLKQQSLLDRNLVEPPTLIKHKDNPTLLATKEKEAIGFYLSAHPLMSLNLKRQYIRQILSMSGQVKVVGIVTYFKEIVTKRNEKMAFVTLEDETDQIEVVLFPRVYASVMNQINKLDMISVQGTMDEESKILAQKVELLKAVIS